MHIGIGGLLHETQTFLPEPTGIDPFEEAAVRGEAMIETFRGTNTSTGGFIDVCAAADVELVPAVHSRGGVSGTVTEAVYDRYVPELRSTFGEAALDGVLLALHGAMVTEDRPDPETDIVRTVRDAVGEEVPIMVALDLHGNLDPAILDVADGICGYRSSPHVDAGETGERTARLLLATLTDDVAPTAAMAKPGLVVPSVFSATTTQPAKSIVDRVFEWQDHENVLDVSFFFGFAWADVPQLGVSAVAITDDDPALAEHITQEFAALAWDNRVGLTTGENLYSVKEGVAYATRRARDAEAPVLLLDHADRMHDTTFVLHELLEQSMPPTAVPLFYDPVAVEACHDAGVGETVTVDVGSRSSERAGGPATVSGTVEWIGNRTYTGTGPMRRGQEIDNGPTAILRIDDLWLQLVSRHANLIDTDPIEQYGYTVDEFDIIVSKSKTHFRAVYEELAAEIVIVDAPAYSPADLAVYEYTAVPDGVYPITHADT